MIGAMLNGCGYMHTVDNRESKLFDPERTAASQSVLPGRLENLTFSSNYCPPPGTTDFLLPGPHKKRSNVRSRETMMRYSPGDRFNIQVPGAAEFSGDYMINADGRIILPYAGEIQAVGLSNSELTKKIEGALVRADLFQSDAFRISVRPVQYAPINITVAGAVFLPGRFVINSINAADKGDKAMTKFGDSPLDRFVPAALRAAGGVRPDADLNKIILVRNGVSRQLNWQGAITGAPVDDFPLLEGDHLFVTEADCFQSALMRPSQITPAGVRVFMSNLTVPSLSNANAAINKDSTSAPYGTRFLAGLVLANCVGGSLASNASRHGILITRNPKTQRTEVIQRPIEELVRSADRDAMNPFLMPDDAIACYDSAITDLREVGTTIQTLITPGQTIANTKALTR